MVDVDSKNITLNYEGGSITMSRGNAKDIFGEEFEGIEGSPVDTEVSVKSHSRTRVIGGSSTPISAYTYTYKQWPTSLANNAAAGTVILMEWEGSEGAFTARVAGSMADCATYLQANTSKVLAFRTQRGTKYGPFAGK